MSTPLREAALDAHRAEARKQSQQAAERRTQSADHLIENWHKNIAHRFGKGNEPDCPERSELRWVDSMTYAGGTLRTRTVTGWEFEIDDVTFIYDASYTKLGLLVVLTCPDCDERHAETFYGLSQLGSLIARGRAHSHRCHSVVARELAYAIKRASEDSHLSRAEIVGMALNWSDE